MKSEERRKKLMKDIKDFIKSHKREMLIAIRVAHEMKERDRKIEEES